MFSEDNLWPIIQSCSSHRPIVKTKAGDSYYVERRLGGGAQSGDVAGVGRDLRFDKSNSNHCCMS
jgi:hypothetical protein